MKVNDIVAVSTMNGTKFGRVVTKDKKRATINVGGNIITAEIRHVTKVHEKKLLKKLDKTL